MAVVKKKVGVGHALRLENKSNRNLEALEALSTWFHL